MACLVLFNVILNFRVRIHIYIFTYTSNAHGLTLPRPQHTFEIGRIIRFEKWIDLSVGLI